MHHQNKVIVITGATRGIGRETAYCLAKEHYSLVLSYKSDVDEARLTESKCRELGAGEVLTLPLDVTDDESVRNFITAVRTSFGEIFALINNAAILIRKPLAEQILEEQRAQVATNIVGVMSLTHQALPLAPNTLIFLGSDAGTFGIPDLSVYCATKFAIRGFSQSLGLELPSINIYCVNPSKTATRMNDFEGENPFRVARVIQRSVQGVYKDRVPNGGDLNVWELDES